MNEMNVISKTLLWLSLIGSSAMVLLYLSHITLTVWLAENNRIKIYGTVDPVEESVFVLVDILWVVAFPLLWISAYLTKKEKRLGKLFKISAATNAAYLMLIFSIQN